MKQYLFSFVLFWVCSLGHAQNVDAIFNEFKDEPNADFVTISPFLMSMGKMFAHGEGSEVLSKIKSMGVLELENCASGVKARFKKCIGHLDTEGYETLIRVNDSGDKVRILAKQKGKYIRELLIICTGESDCMLVRISGKISQKEMDQLVAQQTSKKNGRH